MSDGFAVDAMADNWLFFCFSHSLGFAAWAGWLPNSALCRFTKGVYIDMIVVIISEQT